MTDQPQGQVPATISDGIRDRQVLAAVSLTSRGIGAVMLPTNFNEVVILAEMMSRAGVAVPKHCRQEPGTCMAIVMRATGWGMDPWAVADQTYVVNDRVGYQAKVIAAAIITLAPIKGRPVYTFDGEGPEQRCTVSVTTSDGQTLDYTSPMVKNIKVKNSPEWFSDQSQQLSYFSVHRLGRRHFPEIILGVYTPEELKEMENRDKEEDKPAKSFDALEQRAAVQEPGEHLGAPGGQSLEGAQPQAATDPEPNEDYSEGAAAPGEQYFIAGDPFTETGRRALYKDGQKVSTVGPKEGVKVYRTHPTPAAAEAAGSPASQAVAASSASAGGTEPGTPASGAGTATGPATSTVTVTKAQPDGSFRVKVSFAEAGARPDPGEIYMLGHIVYGDPDGWTAHVARGEGDVLQFWKNGQLVDVTKQTAPGLVWAFSAHPTPTASAQTAGSGQATSASATPASSDSLDLKGHSPPASSQPSEPSELEQALAVPPDDETHFPHAHQEPQDADFEDSGPRAQEEPESPPTTPPGALADFAAAVAHANDWPQIVLALRNLYNDPIWATWTAEERNRPRWVAFVRLREMMDAGYKFDFLSSLQAYRCYIVYETDPDALEGNHRVIRADKQYAALRSDDRNALEQGYETRLLELRGAPSEERMD